MSSALSKLKAALSKFDAAHFELEDEWEDWPLEAGQVIAAARETVAVRVTGEFDLCPECAQKHLMLLDLARSNQVWTDRPGGEE